MKNFLNFFNRLGGYVVDLGVKLGQVGRMVWTKIFRKQAAEQKRAELMRKLFIGMVALIIVALIILLGWYLVGLFNKNRSGQNNITNPIAEVKAYIVTTRKCGDKCWDTGLFLDALTQRSIKITDTKTVYVGWWPWGEGQDFVKKYNIAKLPTLVVEFQGKNNSSTDNFFSPALGNTVGNNFILTQILAPYYDLTDKKIKGLVQVTYLTDKSCPTCYDVKNHETALKNLGVDIKNSRTIDISSADGKALIAKYKITKVPTMIITGEISEYKLLVQAWGEVGTVESDGAYVFTAVDLMGDYYKDLSTGQAVQADASKYIQTPAAAGNSN